MEQRMELGETERPLEFSWPDALCWNTWSPPQHHGIGSALPDDAPQLSSGKLSLTPCFTWKIPQPIITKAIEHLRVTCHYMNYSWRCMCNYPLNLQDNACFIKKERENESRSVLSNSATPWTTQSMEFSRPEYWSGYPFPSSGDLPIPGIKSRSPALQADSLPAEPPGKPIKKKERKKNSSTLNLDLGLAKHSIFRLREA